MVDTNNLTGYAQVVEEIQNNVVSRQYSYGLDLISQRQLISGSYQVSYFLYDGHGSVRGLTDSNGSLTDAYDYDAFGLTINQTGSTPNNYLYAGEQFDPDLGMYFLRARYLEVNRGRFWTQDEFEGVNEEPKSLHKYLYAQGNPLNRIDPSGKADFTIGGISVATLARQALVNIAGGTLLGALYGAGDAALRGDDIIDGAIQGGVAGAIFGALFTVKFLQPVLVIKGGIDGLEAAIDAANTGNYALAAYRGVFTLLGTLVYARSNPEVQAGLTIKKVSGTGRPGRFGNLATRKYIEAAALALEKRGYQITGGAKGLPEEFLAGPGGGIKGGNFIDLTARHPQTGQIIRINTVDTLPDGVTPTPRELAAAASIRAKLPAGQELILIPKKK